MFCFKLEPIDCLVSLCLFQTRNPHYLSWIPCICSFILLSLSQRSVHIRNMRRRELVQHWKHWSLNDGWLDRVDGDKETCGDRDVGTTDGWGTRQSHAGRPSPVSVPLWHEVAWNPKRGRQSETGTGRSIHHQKLKEARVSYSQSRFPVSDWDSYWSSSVDNRLIFQELCEMSIRHTNKGGNYTIITTS